MHHQSGVVPYLVQPNPHFPLNEIQFILVTSRQGSWIFPKGGIEPPLTPQESAEKEGKEEGGLVGMAWSEPCGDYQYEKKNRRYTVSLYLMEVTALLTPWPEMDWRQRRIFSFHQAIQAIDARQRPVLIAAHQILQR